MKVYFISRRRLFVVWIIIGVAIASLYVVRYKNEKALSTFGSPAYGVTVAIDAGHGVLTQVLSAKVEYGKMKST